MADRRLIDANALVESFRESYTELQKYYDAARDDEDDVIEAQLICLVEAMLRTIDAPTIDAVPVVHGAWMDQDYTFTRFTCTACGSKNHGECTSYCPDCGAKMDAKEEEPCE